jgi:hypothetical protein
MIHSSWEGVKTLILEVLPPKIGGAKSGVILNSALLASFRLHLQTTSTEHPQWRKDDIRGRVIAASIDERH